MKEGDKIKCKVDYWIIDNPSFIDRLIYPSLRFRKGKLYEIKGILCDDIVIMRLSKYRTTVFYIGQTGKLLPNRGLDRIFDTNTLRRDRKLKLEKIYEKS